MTKQQIEHDNQHILCFLYRYKHMTAEEIHYFLFPQASRRAVERRMKHLLDAGLIDAHTESHGTPGRSPRLYHLLLAGAQRIGRETLGNQHYRYERPDFRQFTLGLVELRHLAALHGWTLHEDEASCQQALYSFLAQRHKTDVSLRMPARITPDLVLCTDDGSLSLCLRAHPHAGRRFWAERFKRYRSVLDTCRGIAVVLNQEQHDDVRAMLTKLGLERRVLVTDWLGLRKLPQVVAQGKPANPA